MSSTVWIIAALALIFGAAVFGRVHGVRPSSRRPKPARPRPRVEPLRPGESYDNSAKLATVPNAPLADLWCQRLREEGIEAFYKGSPYLAGAYAGLSNLNPGLPTEVWVGENDLERARDLFPELA